MMAEADRASTFTQRSAPFQSRPGRGAILAAIFLLLPAAVMLTAGASTNDFDSSSVAVLSGFVMVLASIVVVVTRTCAFVTCVSELVIVGFAPFWGTCLRRADIAHAAVVSVDAFAEYGGWGVKGSPREPRGRLYSAGGSHAVRLRTHDDRTYVVAFADAEDANRALSAIERLHASP